MKFFKTIVCLAIILTVSCKKDTNIETNDAIRGHWHISNFEPDSSSDVAKLAKEAIAKLIQEDCFPLEYSFTTDNKVSHIDKMGYIEAFEGENGLEVYCFFENIFREGTFSIDNDVLTVNYDDETLTFNTLIENDKFTILKGEFNFNEEKISGKLIFSRE